MNDANTHTLRRATAADLPAVNSVIEAAVMGWALPERVKRLAMPSYRYDTHDLSHLQLWVAETARGIVGVAALDTPGPRELPATATSGLLLHGLYVHPDHQQRGIGAQLLQTAEQQVQTRRLDGLLVRAQREAGDFFIHQDLQPLDTDDHEQDYQHRYWKPRRA
ncbi:GNAT family N-acetyltransferase [Thiohalophilus sp.]|uniref:GNAT family N-acetyltransferase n=1 Tax=Thiohalophilus sp. TaxID=3028392 RepID=UPI002ACE5402|nr:GNAT family N-acetyltransferase [Thiohalophilus sp.]MDZ7662639.1 GNAT family N-acetyltransferase [Thiohalophilus sp.]